MYVFDKFLFVSHGVSPFNWELLFPFEIILSKRCRKKLKKLPSQNFHKRFR